MANFKGDRIEQLKKKLYGRAEFRSPEGRAGFSGSRESVPTAWQSGEDLPAEPNEILSLSLIKKIFLFSFLFFVAVVGLAAYFFLSDTRVVSPENIDITIRAPVSVKGGEILPLELAITNHNPVAIEFADLAIDFPVGTRAADDLSKEMTRFRKHLGTIESGEMSKELVKAAIFGQENTEQEIKISLEYRTKGSNAIFVKEEKYTVLLTRAPVNMIVSLPEEVNAGQEITLEVKLISQADTVLEDLLLEVNYPSGFSFISASPAPVSGSNLWLVGDLSASASRTFKIRGVIEGQEEEVKAFRLTAGLADSKNPRRLAVPYSSSFETLVIRRPFVGLSVTLSGDLAPEISLEPGRVVRGDISWVNNLPGRISDGELLVIFKSSLFSESSVSAKDGFYRSLDKTIIWSKGQLAELALIEPGEGGHLSWSFLPLTGAALVNSGVSNPAIDLEIVFRGISENLEGGLRHFEVRESRRIKLNSELRLSSRAVWSTGPFASSGPMPPRVNQETTYTVIWTITNTTNSIENAVVRATLPSYIRFVDNIFPEAEGVVFDSSRGEIAWDAGRVAQASGGTLARREVAFQIVLTPSISQLSATPVILSESRLTGTDSFTGAVLASSARELNTSISTDPNFRREWAFVAQ